MKVKFCNEVLRLGGALRLKMGGGCYPCIKKSIGQIFKGSD